MANVYSDLHPSHSWYMYISKEEGSYDIIITIGKGRDSFSLQLEYTCSSHTHIIGRPQRCRQLREGYHYYLNQIHHGIL